MNFLKLPLALPPWTHLGKKLESAFRKALYEFEMIKDCKSVAVALSGGKDSLTLLFLLKAISGRGFNELDIHAIHVAGEFSCGASVNKNYLKAICNELNVSFTSVESNQNKDALNCYSCSRERRKLIFDEAKKLGATTIAFGHHRDDSAQTLFMNLFHKAEFAANLPKIAMYDYGVTIIRPLIYISEKEIREFAKLYQFSRITCQCPVGSNSLRKKVDKILDELEEIFPNARANLAKAGLVYGSQKASNR
jgi:tRNA 2-thiocytidine biosynthesis protein TtcA